MKTQKTRGKFKKLVGRAKDTVDIVTGDKKLESEGARLPVEGAVQENLGKARRRVGEVIAEVAKAIKP